MKKTIFLLILFCISFFFYGQKASQKYYNLIREADSLYQIQKYKKSAFTYSSAFKENGWKGYSNDRYNAACSWAMANYPDSAFFNLIRIATLANYLDYSHITIDSDLNLLHEDKRWKPLIQKIKENKEKSEENLNIPLVRILDTISVEDQKYRSQIDEIGKKYGWNSAEMKELWEIINKKDAINLNKVINILETYGWLGPEEIGEKGNTTLFLVIQHSDQKTREKYLSMMREAVKNKRAQASSLALLEDRVALGKGGKQIFGSQIGGEGPNKYYVLPIRDPDSVDVRRKRVGLSFLSDYLNQWNIKWDLEKYKREQELARPIENDNCDIISLNINASYIIEWYYKLNNVKDTFIIEQYRWNKWIKINEVEDSGVEEINHYTFTFIPHNGENLIRIKHGKPICVSDTLKFNSDVAKVKFIINKKQDQIQFTIDTFYEILNNDDEIVKEGFGQMISYKDLPKGSYTINYDNRTAKFKK